MPRTSAQRCSHIGSTAKFKLDRGWTVRRQRCSRSEYDNLLPQPLALRLPACFALLSPSGLCDWSDNSLSRVVLAVCCGVVQAQHGLSYTTFRFSKARVLLSNPATSDIVAKGDQLDLVVQVRNTGTVASAVVVQAYCGFRDTARVRIMRYAQMLCAFTKVFVAPGESTIARYW